jgi:acetylcholinesterase
VVIHGDSAGAGSVAFQMAAYGGRDDHLFVGGMAESPFWPTHRTVPEMEFQFDRFAANVSCSADEAPNGDIMACLRSKDSVTLQSADFSQVFPGGNSTPFWYFLPVVDGNFSQDLLYNQFEQGRIVKVPLLVGDDTDEGTGFVSNASTSAEMLQFLKDNFPNLSSSDLQTINETYPQDIHPPFPNHAAYFPALELAYGENTLICPGIEQSNSIAKYLSSNKVYNYRYNVEDAPTVAAGVGVPHVSEKKAIYGVNNTNPNDLCDYPCSYETYNAGVIPVFQAYWISFILSLDPNAFKKPEAPVWESWLDGEGKAQRLLFETNRTVMEGVPGEQLARCEVWKGLAGFTEQ